MLRTRQGTAVVAAVLAIALALAGAAVAALTTATKAATTSVRVTEREYHIAMAPTSLPAGAVRFTIHNAGHLTHGFALSGAGLASVKKVKQIAPGATRTLTVTLKGGTLRVWCPVPGHAALGMKTTVKVHGTTSGGSTSSGTSTKAWG